MVTSGLKLGELYRKLVEEDFRLLRFMVKNLKRFEYVPIEHIVGSLKGCSQKEIIARIKKLTQLKLLTRRPSADAYRITFLGLDCVALNYLVSRDVIKAIGDRIGVGKESEVYRGLSINGELVAVKFYKIGKGGFKHIAKARGYYEDVSQSDWYRRSIIAGKREREALAMLNRRGGISNVPKFYGGILHCVVMEFVEGFRLNEIRQLKDPEHVFRQIIDTIKYAYETARIVHGDLSEYNIMVSTNNEEKAYIIDWPQYVLADASIAIHLLKRDVENIVKFFKRRYRLYVNLQEILKYVLG